MNGGPKENSNPTVLRVERTTRRRQPLGWSALETLSGSSTTTQLSSIDNSTNRAIRQALYDADQATDGKGIAVLRNVGLEISTADKEDAHNANAFYPMALVNCRSGSNQVPTAVPQQQQQQNTTTENVTAIEFDPIDADEIFEIIRNIQDPEHPLTLEQLGVVSRSQIQIDECSENEISTLDVRFTPTIPHCSMATMIGLCIRVKLLRSLPGRFKVTVRIEPGTHNSENSVNKQLADKERVCAALENQHLLSVVNKCIKQGMETHHTQFHS